MTYYERIEGEWKHNHSTLVFFSESTHPIESVPSKFWNDDRMPAAPVPVCDTATHKLVGPQVIGETVGFKSEALTPEELSANLLQKRKLMIVTPWKFLKALNIKGIRTEVEDMVAQADQDTQDGFQRASSFERLDPLVVTFGYALEKSDQYLDELFELAGTL